jgi:DeoR/GlpR family transcriptional regulator of sugar metabolism
MLTSQRHALLLDRLSQDGRLVVTDLATEFALSEDTLRRDLRSLAAQGRLLRVHGGALPASPTHQPLARRQEMQREAKTRLARAAAKLIEPDQIVILDGGSTHLALVAALPTDLRATIVTHSPGIAAALERHSRIDVILVGGRIFRHSMVSMGPATAEAFGRLRADLCFLGVTGVQAQAGLTTGDADEAALKSIMSRSAAEVVVLATPDKLGAASPWTIAPLSGLNRLVGVEARPDWLPPGCAYLPA